MDDFTGILARDFGFKPQGKSAPMAPPRNSPSAGVNNFSATPSFGLGSSASDFVRSSSTSNRSKSNSNPIFDDHDRGGDGLLFNDVFGGPPKYASASDSRTTQSSSAFDYDSIFKDQGAAAAAKSASMPVYDKPVYDDDIFEGLPGLKNSTASGPSVKYEDVFSSISSPPSSRPRKQENSAFDDLLGGFGKKETESKKTEKKDTPTAFDDLIPGFGGSSSATGNRSTSESGRSQKPSSDSSKTASNMMEDPFVVLESTSSTTGPSSASFTDPLEHINKFSSSGSTKADRSSLHGGVFEDLDPLESFGKSMPEISKKGQDKSHPRTGNASGVHSPVENSESHSQKKVPVDDFQDSYQTQFDIPSVSVGQATSPPHMNGSPNEINSQVNSTARSDEYFESSDDVWLTVSEIPLFTQPTSAPPPARPPPPRPTRPLKSDTGSFTSTNMRKKVNEYSSFPNSTQYPYSPNSARASTRNAAASPIDELEDFAMGRTQNDTNEDADAFPGEDMGTNSVAAASAAAMKEAMDKAEAKFRHAREMREREYLKTARSKEGVQLDKDDYQERELREKQERLDHERQQREREDEEREQRRLEKEREREEREREEREREQRRLEKERIERERDLGRQAVERATREARERAAAEARERAVVEARKRAEKAVVEKVAAEARERAEKFAVQRAQAEARERAAAEAKERAERAAAEARERAERVTVEARAAVEREREARDRNEARVRAERAAVERAAAEARERAAAEARERAATAARANQQKNENDLESFFSMGSRPSSAPRPRANSSDPVFDTQKGGPEATRRTSVGTSTSMRKASSTANIVDDLSSIFGAGSSPSGEFQEVEGETEERRRARLERYQRTQERAAKALAEKNQRDLQAQREQAERHRIAETLDIEIKRWAAGKEGNLRVLLSTLQYVLWPECGWQPVSLTDLITAPSVKKVYRKATLCIHPDKVQQKGANLQQKYVAEKVFDLLKEAWNKFNSEELF